MLDVTELLQPIADNSAVGKDLRAQGHKKYLELKSMRLAARNQERDALYNEDISKDLNLWRTVIKLGSELLREETKDLTIAAWITEGLTRVHGFNGLANGISLLHGLVQQYWAEIYPLEDEDGLATKVAPIIGLNGEHGDGTLIAPINSISLTKSNLEVASWQYQQALNYSKVNDPDKLKKLLKSGILTLEKINESVIETPINYFIETEQQIQHCLTVFNELNQLLNEVCGAEHAPPTSNIIQALRFCLETVQSFIRKVKPAVNTIAEDELTDNEDEFEQAHEAKRNNRNSNIISNKEQAFNNLLEIAKFFRQHEPHSPVSYLLEQAVKLGNLSLPELLSELIPDQRMLEYSCRMIGVQYQNNDEAYEDDDTEQNE